MILLIDNFDSFTYNLVDYFAQLGVGCDVRRNDLSLPEVVSPHYTGLVLSPGPETPAKAGNLLNVLDYYSTRLPILGVCLGHQAICEYFGARLEKAERPMHGKLTTIESKDSLLFKGLPASFKVVRYNSLVAGSIPNRLKVTAVSDNGEVMAVEHRSLPIYGIQFHPEAILTEYGLEMLKNWMLYNNIVSR